LIAACLLVTAFAAYGVDRGIYVGSTDYLLEEVWIIKECRYLFVTGVSEIPARGGIFEGTPLRGQRKANETDRLYCRLFGD
jgi:hypothetical protein